MAGLKTRLAVLFLLSGLVGGTLADAAPRTLTKPAERRSHPGSSEDPQAAVSRSHRDDRSPGLYGQLPAEKVLKRNGRPQGTAVFSFCALYLSTSL